ncbi:MAG TPA: hypothetical protein DIT10_01310 [Chryseobacterium sp.]|nr:hypothetical protein [Chryseobacterium sp.]
MICKQKDSYFIILPIVIFINLIIAWYIGDYLTPDSYDYIEIADHLPIIKDSLFPIFYPSLLKIINIIINDYLITYKIINIISILFCFIYTYKFKFYWKEIWAILAFSSFQYNYIFAWSENIIIPLLIIFLHLNYLFYTDKIDPKKYLLKNTITLVLLILTKYNSIFFVFPTAILSLLYLRLSKKYFYALASCFISVLVLVFYLFLNYQFTGYFTGNRSELTKLNFMKYISLSKYEITTTIEPFGRPISKIVELQSLTHIWQLPYLLSLGILGILGIAIFSVLKKSKYYVSKYNVFLIANSLTFICLTLVSAYFTRIDVLGPRLLLGFSFPLLLALFVFIKANKINLPPFLLIGISLISAVLHTITSIIYGYI